MSAPDASSKLIESGKVQQAADNCLKHTQIAEDLPDFIIIDLKEALYKHQNGIGIIIRNIKAAKADDLLFRSIREQTSVSLVAQSPSNMENIPR